MIAMQHWPQLPVRQRPSMSRTDNYIAKYHIVITTQHWPHLPVRQRPSTALRRVEVRDSSVRVKAQHSIVGDTPDYLLLLSIIIKYYY